LSSPIFDPVSGFGGNGARIPSGTAAPYIHSTNAGGCLTDGPFKDRIIRIGPFGKMKLNNTRCLRRDLNGKVVEKQATKKTLAGILKAKTYAKFCEGINGALHGVGHGGIGGEVFLPIYFSFFAPP
jgi:tyrosinase